MWASPRTHNRPAHTEVADQQPESPDHSIDHCSTRHDTLVGDHHNIHHPVGKDCWHRRCSTQIHRNSRHYRAHGALHLARGHRAGTHALGRSSPDSGRLDSKNLLLVVDERIRHHNDPAGEPT